MTSAFDSSIRTSIYGRMQLSCSGADTAPGYREKIRCELVITLIARLRWRAFVVNLAFRSILQSAAQTSRRLQSLSPSQRAAKLRAGGPRRKPTAVFDI
jgi:hypothetical protein